MRSENRITEVVCNLIELLDSEGRRRLVRVIIDMGYSAKEVAEMAGVTASAISRYVHGSLTPSHETLCRLVVRLSGRELESLVLEAIKHVWLTLREAIARLPANLKQHILEELADDIASMLAKAYRSSS